MEQPSLKPRPDSRIRARRTAPAAPAGGPPAESERRRPASSRLPGACFGRLGFAGATVEAIAGEAGVSNGLLYQFFRSKEHLLGVVLDELVRDWARAIAAGEREPSAARARGHVPQRLRLCARQPAACRAPHGRRAAPARAVPASSADRVEAHRDLVARILRRGVGVRRVRSRTSTWLGRRLVCQLQADYSSRAYRRDPLHPADPALSTPCPLRPRRRTAALKAARGRPLATLPRRGAGVSGGARLAAR